MSSPFPLRTSVLLMFALGVAACADADAPLAVEIDRPQPTVLLRATTAIDLQLCVADALERIAPGLESSAELDKVEATLGDVADALEKRHPQQLTNASHSFKDALDAFFAAKESRSFDPDAAALRILSEDLEAVSSVPPLDTLRTN
jgi:hypothetical protein